MSESMSGNNLEVIWKKSECNIGSLDVTLEVTYDL